MFALGTGHPARRGWTFRNSYLTFDSVVLLTKPDPAVRHQDRDKLIDSGARDR